jgi:sucrose synthase
MKKALSSYIDEQEIPALQEFLFSLERPEPHSIILHNDIMLAFEKFRAADNNTKNNGIAIPENMPSSLRFLRKIQEILHLGDELILMFRYRRATSRIYRLSRQAVAFQQIAIKDFLSIKERLIKTDLPIDHRSLEINLAPFYDYGPSLKDPETIGDGIKHLNRYMSSNLFQQQEKWTKALYEFLKLHHLHGMQLLIDSNVVPNIEELESALEDAVDFLDRCECPDDRVRIKVKLKSIGFLEGWGDTAARILETMNLLQDILEQPNEETLAEFLSRIPMVSKVVLVSPHGWFGQKNVLGRPDTGGQVVYILDQAKALERYLEKDLQRSGIDIAPKVLIITRLIPENEGTTSDQRLEKVEDTKNVSILRVPFRNHDGTIVNHWISRFRIWPYLDRFAIDVQEEILAELPGRPDLIVGNYSDGNLVATILAKSLGVIQCNVAHALEKSKYLFSDLFWEEFEEEYHFSVQFVADLLAMNLANFIITSTRQEITGTADSIGQYESYQFFNMPGLLQVTNGINLFHPRFNVIPPGVNEEIFFPYFEQARRDADRTLELDAFLFTAEDPDCFGQLTNPDLPPIFSIARLDRIKNLTGLVEAFGQDESLRNRANIVIIASMLNPDHSRDGEEAAEIRKMYGLIDQYELHGHIRWIGKLLSKKDTGEAYRIMADRRGVFVQPALFEAFGLTILEAMHSGLPVFATEFGGPQEIIVNNRSGFLINPTVYKQMTGRISDFFASAQEDGLHWDIYSKAAVERAQSRFTWERYCRLLTRLTKVYGFWKYSTSHQAKSRLIQYCHLLHELFYKLRAERIES